MTRDVRHCSDQDSLAAAARVLWEHDCGCVPVLDGRGQLKGMLTDRDICMAAYRTGLGLQELKVVDIMDGDVATIGPQASLHSAEQVMRLRGVGRLPVIDEARRAIGLITSLDLCWWVDDGGSNGARYHHSTHLVGTLAAIGRFRGPAAAASMAERPSTILDPSGHIGGGAASRDLLGS